MQEILTKFEEYLFLYRQVAVSTYNAYAKDIREFCAFLATRESSLLTITPNDFTLFLNALKHKRVGSATALRKISALKLFAQYLQEKHDIADCTTALTISTSSTPFPLLCTQDQLHHLINYYKTQSPTYTTMRLYIILMLLATGRLGVNTLRSLTKHDICFAEHTIRVFSKRGQKKEVFLSGEFFKLLKQYISLIPYKTAYLFPIEVSGTIKPISRQALWSMLKQTLKNKQDVTAMVTQSEASAEIDPTLYTLYKNKHPRA